MEKHKHGVCRDTRRVIGIYGSDKPVYRGNGKFSVDGKLGFVSTKTIQFRLESEATALSISDRNI